MICLIKYDQQKKVLAIYPDFSKNHDKPYVLETDVDRKIYFYFTLEHVSNFKLSDTVIKNTGIAKVKISVKKYYKNINIFLNILDYRKVGVQTGLSVCISQPPK